MSVWTHDNIKVFECLQKKVLNKLDKSIEKAEDRLTLVNNLLGDDEVSNALMEYWGSLAHREKIIKQAWLSEKDYNLKKFEFIADYLVYPQRKENNILSKYALMNSGFKVGTNKKMKKFKKVLSLSQVQILFREDEDGWQRNESEYIFRKNVKELYSNKTYIERIIDNSELLDDNIYLVVKFDNIEHIRSILRIYDELKDKLISDKNYESDVWRVLDTLDDLIVESDFSYDMSVIIDLMKRGLSYSEIHKEINNVLKCDYTYNQVKYAVKDGIPLKIVNTYNNKNKNFNYFVNRYHKIIKNNSNKKSIWVDEKTKEINKKRNEKYYEFTKPSEVKVYFLKK